MKRKITFVLLCIISYAQSQNITFTDPAFKAVLVNSDVSAPNDYIYDASFTPIKLDADSDGEISYAEAANVYAILALDQSVLANVVTIDNLQNFTGLNILYFFNASNLVSVDITNNNSVIGLSIGDAPLLSTVNVSSCSSFSSIYAENVLNLSTVTLNNLPQLASYALADPGAIQAINLSAFPLMETVVLSNAAQLTSLNVKNGSTEDNISLVGLNALSTVCADDNEIATWQSAVTQSGSSATVTNCNALSVADIEKTAAKLEIYPNPVKDWVTVKSNHKISKVEIYSVSGKIVKESKEATLHLGDLSKGIYFIKAYSNEGILKGKIIKE